MSDVLYGTVQVKYFYQSTYLSILRVFFGTGTLYLQIFVRIKFLKKYGSTTIYKNTDLCTYVATITICLHPSKKIPTNVSHWRREPKRTTLAIFIWTSFTFLHFPFVINSLVYNFQKRKRLFRHPFNTLLKCFKESGTGTGTGTVPVPSTFTYNFFTVQGSTITQRYINLTNNFFWICVRGYFF